MLIAFDAAKDAINVEKHGVEQRFKAIGWVGGRFWTAAHVVRGDMIRFISVRRSNDGEERAYRD
jgi:uncharacterized DUF497 family protein